MSNCVVRSCGSRLPCSFVADHGIEGGDHLSHDGDDNDFRFLVGCGETIVKDLEGGIVSGCAEGSHVEDVTDRQPTTVDAAMSFELAAVEVVRRKSDEGSDLLAVHLSELWQESDAVKFDPRQPSLCCFRDIQGGVNSLRCWVARRRRGRSPRDAQQPDRMRRIGVLMARFANDPEGQKQAAAFQRSIEELGWSPGRSVEIEYRWHAGDASQAQAFAKELVDWRPDVLVANSTPSLVAARQATSTIPIVFVAVADPVAQGFVQSLARPGGNITGFAAEEPSMGAKWVQLLSEIAPRLGSITVMFNPNSAPFARMFLPTMEARPCVLCIRADHFAGSQRDRNRPCHRCSEPPAIRRPDRSAG